jgi:hypothetical protein
MNICFIIAIVFAFFALSDGFKVHGGRGGKGARREKRHIACMKKCKEDLARSKHDLVNKYVAKRIAENPQYVIVDNYTVTIDCYCDI